MKTKTFDCVEMKNRLQRKRLNEYEGLSLEEREKRMRERIQGDPILGPVYRELINRREYRHLEVAEAAPRYETRRS